jgi:DNA-binding response OmpR family regulator
LFKEKSYITKGNLLLKVWGFNENVKTRTLETHIYRLRKKIKDRFGLKQFITTNKDSYKL